MAKATTIIDGAKEMTDAIITEGRYSRDDADEFIKRYIYDERGEVAYIMDIDRGTVTYFAFECANTIKIGKRNCKKIIASIPVHAH